MLPVFVLAQDADIFPPPAARRLLSAQPITRILQVDGILDEAEWQACPPTSGFTQVEPLQGEPASQQTDLRFLYNRQFLYVGIFCRDSLGRKALRATDFRRDFDPRQHDLVNLAFDGFLDDRNAMVFATNPYGVQRDLLSFDDVLYDVDWDGMWRVRTARTDSGWIAEIAIPWQTLRYPAAADSLREIGFNLYRNRRFSNEISAFAPFPRIFGATRMDYAGRLANLSPPPPKPNVRLQPYLRVSLDRYRTAGSGDGSKEGEFKPGGDLKWAIRPHAVLDLTFQTDFAQADVDRQVNNVTRFSVFFPERRQFFLENASLFGFNVGQAGDGSGGSMRLQPFFSRSIGLDAAGRPLPIEAGGRFVSRSTRGNYGLIAMRQGAAGDSPATHFLVGRYTRNIGSQHRLGALATIRQQPEATNVVGTVDGFFRLSESKSVQAIFSHSAGGQVTENGFAGMVQYVHATNDFKFWVTPSVVTRHFNPEMGFVSRKDVIGLTPGLNWYYRGKHLPWRKLIRAFEPGFLPEFYWQASTGQMTERQYWFFPLWLNFEKGGYLGYGLVPAFQRLSEPFEPLGLFFPVRDYRYFRQQLWFSTDPSRVLYLFGQIDGGSYFNGRLLSADISLQCAPSPYFSLIGRLNRNRFSDAGVPAVDATIDLFSVEGRLALNPRLQLVGFYQQNTGDNARNVNLRLSWEFAPLSFVYLVYNHNGDEDDWRRPRREDHAIFKVSYLRQL